MLRMEGLKRSPQQPDEPGHGFLLRSCKMGLDRSPKQLRNITNVKVLHNPSMPIFRDIFLGFSTSFFARWKTRLSTGQSTVDDRRVYRRRLRRSLHSKHLTVFLSTRKGHRRQGGLPDTSVGMSSKHKAPA